MWIYGRTSIHNTFSISPDTQHHLLQVQFLEWLTEAHFIFSLDLFTPQSIFHSFQKWVIFIAYDKRIIKGNVVDFSFPLNCGTHKHGNSHIGVFKCLTTFVWDIWSISAMSRVLWLGLFLIHFSVWSSVTVDLPKLSWSSRSKFPLLNLANHLQTVLSPSTMASSP